MRIVPRDCKVENTVSLILVLSPIFYGGCSLENMSLSNICLYEAAVTRQVHCKTSTDTRILSFQLKMVLEARALFSAGRPDL